ncbi:ATP-binding protein, partial [Microcoleus sp. herbarium19]
SGEHLLTLINQALDLAKIEAGRMTLFPTNFDLYCLLDELQEMFDLRAKNQGLQLIFQREADIPQYVRSDEVKLRQVLINLLSNAMKFTQIGGVSVRVRRKLAGISASGAIANTAEISEEGEIVSSLENSTDSDLETSNYPEILRISSQPESEILANTDTLNIFNSLFLEFEIEDTGVGIAPEELGNLFQAFVQTSSGQKAQQGTGLGLTISSEFVRLMGGDITVESQLERGTIFRFAIEVSAVDAAAITTPKIICEVIGMEPDQPYYRILIVDDRTDNRKLLVKMLSGLGFGVQEASNGREAVEMWENWQPHLIFMDLRMPVMDGYEATIEIRARIQRRKEEEQGEGNMDLPNPEFLNPKIVALTASTHEDKRSFSLLMGCDDFIRKPFRKMDIFDTLSKHLGVRYIYSDLTGSDAMGEGNNQSNYSNTLSASLPDLPAEWIDNMRLVIRSADFDLIEITIDEIRDAHPEFAEILQGHLDNFDYQKILNLIVEAENFNGTEEV